MDPVDITMNQCPYCGRQNDDAAQNCRECSTALPTARGVAKPEEPSPSHPFPVEVPPPLRGPRKSVASIDLQTAQLLKDRLYRESIPAAIEVVKHESGMDWFEVVVEEPNYDAACRVAERWEEELADEQVHNTKRVCPQCGSSQNEFVTTESFGHVWRCNDCGRAFIG